MAGMLGKGRVLSTPLLLPALRIVTMINERVRWGSSSLRVAWAPGGSQTTAKRQLIKW